MIETQTASWIFLATAIASKSKPAEIASISSIADGINHAIPTPKELQSAMSWLIKHELITKNGNKYCLTEKGKMEYEESARKTSALLKIWDNLERNLSKY